MHIFLKRHIHWVEALMYIPWLIYFTGAITGRSRRISHHDPEKPSNCEPITKWRLPLPSSSQPRLIQQSGSPSYPSYFSGILLHQELYTNPNIWYSNAGNLNLNQCYQCYQLCLTGWLSLFKNFFNSIWITMWQGRPSAKQFQKKKKKTWKSEWEKVSRFGE